MRYLCAIPVVLLFVVFDVFLTCSLFGAILAWDAEAYPVSWRFVQKVWA